MPGSAVGRAHDGGQAVAVVEALQPCAFGQVHLLHVDDGDGGLVLGQAEARGRPGLDAAGRERDDDAGALGRAVQRVVEAREDWAQRDTGSDDADRSPS